MRRKFIPENPYLNPRAWMLRPGAWPTLDELREITQPELRRTEYGSTEYTNRHVSNFKDRREIDLSWWGCKNGLSSPNGFTRRGDRRPREMLAHTFFAELLDHNLRRVRFPMGEIND